MQASLLAFYMLLFIAVLVPILFHFSRHLGPTSRATKNQDSVYESGVSAPFKQSSERFSVNYYMVAIIFVLFDVEILFMFPWAVTIKTNAMVGIIEMFIFISLLLLGLLYVYLKRALQWDE